MPSFVRFASLFCAVSFLASTSNALNIPRAGEAISGGLPTAPSAPSSTVHLGLGSTSTATPSTRIMVRKPTRCSVDLSLITPDPAWGTQKIPDNTCSASMDTTIGGESTCIMTWSSCRVTAASVDLYYWTKLPGNQTHPKSIFNTEYNITMTSPSVYVAYKTVTAANDCGRVGPIIETTVLPFDLEEVSTLIPYGASSEMTLTGTQRLDYAPLTLSDFENCKKQTTATYDPRAPIAGDNYRCNPQLYFTQGLKHVGDPYWRGCGRANGGQYGLNDPPHAIEPCASDDCLIPTDPSAPAGNPDVTTTAAPVVPTTIAPIEAPATTESPVVPPVVTVHPATPVPTTPVQTPTVPEPTVSVVASTVVASPVESNGQAAPIPNTPVGNPASSNVIIPIPPASADPASPAPASSAGIIIGTQTAIIGGPAITVAGAGVATANPSGVVIAYPNGVIVSVPASPPQPSAVSNAQPSEVSNALPSEVAIVSVAGNSPLTSPLAIVVAGQTATVGGPAVTLSAGVVASAASGGLVVQSGGVVSTIPVVSAPTGVIGASKNGTTPVLFTGGAGVLGVGAGGLLAGIAAVLML